MPKFEKIYPYFHPTTVVVIDDDPEFLDSFLFRFRRSLLCQIFREPGRAIHHIRQTTPPVSRYTRYLEAYGDASSHAGWSPADQSIAFRPAAVRDIIYDTTRFAEVSVAIIDYDMPDMNGIEVCQRLRDLPLKKLMLTGKADERLATAAFNDRLIDHFLIKQDVNLTDRIGAAIPQLQEVYFEQVRIRLEGILGLQDSAFIVQPAFGRFLAEVLLREQAVEYYLSALPPGVLMLRADGTARMLLVQDEAALQFHEDVVRHDAAAPRALLDRLERRDCQSWFPTRLGQYEAGSAAWEDFVYPAKRVGAWYCSVIAGDARRCGLDGPVVSYESHRCHMAAPDR